MSEYKDLALDKLERGRRISGRLEVGTSASGQAISVPYIVVKGARQGPTLWVNAAVHGDEVNGTLAAIEFAKVLDPGALSGTVLVTPVANVVALDERRKNGSLDQLDLDQSFPGMAAGLSTQRHAKRIFDAFASVSDVIVNLHTLGAPFDSKPYAVYKLHPYAKVSEQRLLAYISCFSPNFACRMPVNGASGELPGNIAGALDYQCLATGKAAFMIELGGGGRQEPEHIAAGVDGLDTLARLLGILPRGEVASHGTKLTVVTKRQHIMSDAGGFFRPAAVPSAIVEKGQPLGRVHDVFGSELTTVTFDRDALVIAIRRDPVVHSGDRIVFVGFEWETADVDV